ncbi:MAG: hypothetical protein GXO74_05085 [Calditrichaeota bacterium]|nr:hypothetical protein [Calditrichota bacterium]
MKKKKKIQRAFVIIFIISLAGFILCFPLKLSSGKTCLLHLFSGHDSTYEMESAEFGNNRDQILMNRYLKPFAFLWWMSLLGIGYSLPRLAKK